MNYHDPLLGNAQLYSPVSTPPNLDNNNHINNHINSPLSSSIAATPADSSIGPYEPLTDGFSRRLTYLRLSITDFCNFRCEYCLPNGYQGKRPDDELSVAEIATLIRGFAQVGTRKVRITGGEPSIRRDVVDIIRTIKQTPGIETVAMTSNGYKLGKHLANWQAAGLNQINISMDSFDASTFHKMTGFDMLPQLLADMDQLLATTDIKLKINAVLMAETAFQTLLSAMDYIKSRPVTYRFIEFMQTSDNSDLFFAQHAHAGSITDYLLEHGWQPHDRGSADGPAIEYSHPDYVGRIGMIAPYAAHFCDNCNRLRVSSLGKVHLCLFDQGNYDIREHLKNDDIEGLVSDLQGFMPIKPEHHHLHDSNSGMMHNLSLIGG
ncbi:cyclic pyranopterin phosphate synthase [Psychrobacter sp. PL19]|uniref:GTP 3',8-cyclase MoaA n=1 Tax=Psychrobacter sp. PL19 TaxID=2760711 RepID=UPI001AE7312F